MDGERKDESTSKLFFTSQLKQINEIFVKWYKMKWAVNKGRVKLRQNEAGFFLADLT